MRQFFLLLSVLLLGLTWSVAQNTDTSQSSTSTGAQQHSNMAGQNSRMASGGHVTVEGCLSGTGGNYSLTAKNGMTYKLEGDATQLADHVGHEVKVTGMSEKEEAGENTSTGTSGATGTAEGHEIQVKSVKQISKTCRSGAGAMSH